MLTETRRDHGAHKDGSFACYVRVSTDKQDVENQEHAITTWLNGGNQEVTWFREEGVSSGTPWDQRQVLQDCISHCRKTGATMVVYSISRIARKMWETLRFLENEISSGKIKLVVVDDPTLDEMTIGFKAMFAQHERKQIQMRTKASLSRIKAEIEEKGSYTARSGRVITKLGVHDNLDKAGKKGNAVQAAKADARAEELATMLTNFRTQGLSYREIANQLNLMGVPTTKNRRNPDQSVDDRSQWYASTVRNYVKRLGQ